MRRNTTFVKMKIVKQSIDMEIQRNFDLWTKCQFDPAAVVRLEMSTGLMSDLRMSVRVQSLRDDALLRCFGIITQLFVSLSHVLVRFTGVRLLRSSLLKVS